MTTPHRAITGRLIALGVAALCGMSAAVIAWLGMLPSRGPMYPGPYQADGIVAGMTVPAGQPVGNSYLWVYNPSRVDVTLDSIEPVDPTPDMRVVGAWLPVDTPWCQRAALESSVKSAPSRCQVPVDGYILPSGTPVGQGPRLVVELQANERGTYRAGGFAIHYHVGPIHYTTLYSNGLILNVR
jgi:hypothetical protein